jgi:hypothetical protein
MLKHVFALVLLLSPAVAWPKPWNGITPGESMRADVLQRFGEPSKTVAQSDGKELLAYTAEQAINGTTQAQFTVLPSGKIEQIVVFPSTSLDVADIEDTFGKACAAVEKTGGAGGSCYSKQLTDDFRSYFWYKRLGLVVFFNEDKRTVHSILYNVPALSGPVPARK